MEQLDHSFFDGVLSRALSSDVEKTDGFVLIRDSALRFISDVGKNVNFDLLRKNNGKIFSFEEFKDDILFDGYEEDFFGYDKLKDILLFCISLRGESEFFFDADSSFWSSGNLYNLDGFFKDDDLLRINRVKSEIVNFSLYRISKVKFFEYTISLDEYQKKIISEISSLKISLGHYKNIKEEVDKKANDLVLAAFSEGFSSDLKLKISEHKKNFWFVFVFGLLALLIPLVSAWLSFSSRPDRFDYYSGFYNGTFSFSSSGVSLALSFFAAELLILYFFRICLVNGNNLKSQIIQLRLRFSVSKFLSDYLNNKEIENKRPETLARYEELIFRDISVDGSPSVSVFDGFEQVAKIISSAKSK